VIGTLEPGTMVKVLGDRKQVDGITWNQIRVNDKEGWVLQAFLSQCA
jgi:hypothetical protein